MTLTFVLPVQRFDFQPDIFVLCVVKHQLAVEHGEMLQLLKKQILQGIK